MSLIRPAPRLGDHLYEAILTMINTQKLVEGARLPAEHELAAQFGVSRPIVRETLSRLRDEGLIVSRRGSGSYVGRRELVHETHASADLGEVNSFDQIEKCYEFRKVIEGEACALAAVRHTPNQLQTIRQALTSLESVVERRVVGSDADFEFHLALSRASGNDWFVSVMQSLRSQIEFTIEIARSLSLGRPAEHLKTVQSEHMAILIAVEARNAAKARDAMRQHLTSTCARIFRGPKSSANDVDALSTRSTELSDPTNS